MHNNHHHRTHHHQHMQISHENNNLNHNRNDNQNQRPKSVDAVEEVNYINVNPDDGYLGRIELFGTHDNDDDDDNENDDDDVDHHHVDEYQAIGEKKLFSIFLVIFVI